jgi:hypothetical protein
MMDGRGGSSFGLGTGGVVLGSLGFGLSLLRISGTLVLGSGAMGVRGSAALLRAGVCGGGFRVCGDALNSPTR